MLEKGFLLSKIDVRRSFSTGLIRPYLLFDVILHGIRLASCGVSVASNDAMRISVEDRVHFKQMDSQLAFDIFR